MLLSSRTPANDLHANVGLRLPVALIALTAVSRTDAQHGASSGCRAGARRRAALCAVRGAPGEMTVQSRPCRILPTGETRRRIVDVAVQEWGFFGFRIVDQTEVDDRAAPGGDAAGGGGASPDLRRGGRRVAASSGGGARVAASIAGYWAVTPEGSWIVGRQNDAWQGPDGTAVRWNAPWSAAFVSWVMCEAGLGTRASSSAPSPTMRTSTRPSVPATGARRRRRLPPTTPAKRSITPGDLLCSSRRPAYRTIAERRRQIGVGARTHCDVVVKVDEARERILAIGGNVRGVVSLKLLRRTARRASRYGWLTRTKTRGRSSPT